MFALSRFINVNRRCCRILEARLPASFRQHLHTIYKFEVARLVDSRPGQIVVDVGGGKECPFLPFLRRTGGHCIIALDFSADELRLNRDPVSKIVADASGPGLPFADSSVDLIVSRSVVEHLPDNAAFFQNCARALRPGGILIHTFPCRFAPFALLNQILPNRVTRRLLAVFYPDWVDHCGFPAHYDKCYYSQMRDLLDRNGFHHCDFTFRYYQSIYFDFFVPLYVIMLGYDLLIAALGLRNLACGLLLRAELAAVSPHRGALV